MSTVAQEITRLRQAKADIRTAIEGKGVSVPEDVLIDTYDSYIEQIPQGGAVQEKQFNFYDYDGLLLYSFTYDEIQSMVELPALPTTTRDDDYDQYYTAHGWTHTLDELKAYDSDAWVDVGALYESSADRNYFYITVPRDNYKVYVTESGTVNWGDGSAEETYTRAEYGIDSTHYHTYTNAGEYVLGFTGILDSHQLSYSGKMVNVPVVYGEDEYIPISASLYDYDYITKKIVLKADTKVAFLKGMAIRTLIVPYNIRQYTSEAVVPLAKCLIIGDQAGQVNFPSFSDQFELERVIIKKCLPNQFGGIAKTKITRFEIPKEIPSVGPQAFLNCYWLEHLIVPSSMKYNSRFLETTAIKKFKINDGTTMVEDSMFKECYKLEEVEIPNTVTKIASSAFYNCHSLKNITLPPNLESIASSAFYNCRNIETIELPESMKLLDSSAFSSCRKLKEITIPSSCQLNGTSNFDNCMSLEKIEIKSTLTKIGISMLSYCSSLKNFEIPSTVVGEIGQSAFRDCKKAFSDVVIPKGVTSIGQNAFYNCYSLKSVVFDTPTASGEGISKLGNYSFYNCYSLQKVVIPAAENGGNSLTSIGTYSFYGCNNLVEFHIGAETPPTLGSTNVFYNCPFTKVTTPIQGYIYVPYSEDHHILNAYKSASNWSTMANWILEEPAE